MLLFCLARLILGGIVFLFYKEGRKAA
jgi:hypothetical protein